MPQVAYFVADTLGLPHHAGTAIDAGSAADREPADVRALLDRARAGDQSAFGQLVDRHHRVVYRTALAALGRPEDAEDAAQDAFLQAWRHLAAFRGDSAFRTWLLAIAWRKALDRRRTRLLGWKRAAAPGDRDPLDGLAHGSPDPERAAVARDTAERVRREIDRLSPVLRDTLLLVASGDHSYQEIATLLNTPIGTVKWRVAEARRIVSRRMQP